MKTISLFSGCGGMDFGIKAAGCDVVFANDVMKYAAETHRKYFKDTDFIHGDIREISNFPSTDLVVGGYPCQSFSMGGNRKPENDPRTYLFKEFARAVEASNPKFFIAENVSGLKSVQNGQWLKQQIDVFEDIGNHGYNTSFKIINSQDYGVPQRRKRLFVIGVRRDLGGYFHFPTETHCKLEDVKKTGLLPHTSHGEVIKHLPKWPSGEFYERPHDPEGHFSWYYMSRNRKAEWNRPSYTVVANFRHTTLHPASPTMKLTWSNLADGFKQRWDFTDHFEHLDHEPEMFKLEEARRLSWREAACIQTFPRGFEPAGDLMRKFEQIGNAVPPKLIEVIAHWLKSEQGLKDYAPTDGVQKKDSQLKLL
ncbi:putative C-5 cytosine-specific DNA methylase [Octadecabacter arcticus 238]|jgi:DNA (cytosine-5)-methyltransferase 1|uniref:Cytosine-specific methyltransferase n=1 Tax=Octadecabacter arcticus 238 TaxID=391616 RepID=M9RIJ9_9RHOB|nr:DNA cytosine methyltransferase [Octadecabacter arcticus]AGI71992.1 putative C-5 cytosine-specific DNA methylase [Octadecabacter arcticus 238]